MFNSLNNWTTIVVKTATFFFLLNTKDYNRHLFSVNFKFASLYSTKCPFFSSASLPFKNWGKKSEVEVEVEEEEGEEEKWQESDNNDDDDSDKNWTVQICWKNKTINSKWKNIHISFKKKRIKQRL